LRELTVYEVYADDEAGTFLGQWAEPWFVSACTQHRLTQLVVASLTLCSRTSKRRYVPR
jgi:hypothetical protein